RRLVQTGRDPLELTQRLPLGLTDRLAGGLDPLLSTRLPLAHRRPPRFFFRFTRRGALEPERTAAPSAGAGAGEGAAPSVSSVTSFGGVREERFGGGAGLGTIRRVMIPCPTVQRLVVIQW